MTPYEKSLTNINVNMQNQTSSSLWQQSATRGFYLVIFTLYIVFTLLFYHGVIDKITPIIGLFVGFVGLAYVTLGQPLKPVQWLIIVSLLPWIFIIWTNEALTQFTNIKPLGAITYQYTFLLFSAVIGRHIKLPLPVLFGLVGAFITFSGFVPPTDIENFRFNTIYGSAINQLGAVLVLCAGVVLWGILKYKNKMLTYYNILLIILLFISLFGILLLGSRQAVVLVATMSVFFFWFFKLRFAIPLITAIFATFFALSNVLQLRILDRFISMINYLHGVDVAEGSIPLRLHLLEEGFKAFLNSPLSINGIHAFEQVFGYYAHNNYLEVAYNFGFIGFASYYSPLAVLIIWCLKNLRTVDRQSSYFILIVWLILFLLTKDLFIVSYGRYVTWVSLGLIMYSISQTQTEKKERKIGVPIQRSN